jgi:hypothetical protein
VLARAAAPAPAEARPVAPLGRRTAPTSAARLAAATGARVSHDEAAETETVEFQRPEYASFAPALELMRAGIPGMGDIQVPHAAGLAGNAMHAAEGALSGHAAPAAHGEHHGGHHGGHGGAEGGGGGGNIDEIYDQVVQRLKRDLLADRERMGDLLGDLP